MGLIEIILIALSLAMDAFAVSLAAASSGKIDSKRAVFRLSFHFGLFQFMMPIIGWFSGENVEPIIAAYDHWIAFVLLLLVGIHMILSGLYPDKISFSGDPSKGFKLVALSVATSIDALAVGFSLALLHIDIWYPSFIIGISAAGMSLLGIQIGKYLGRLVTKHMIIIGGSLLILIGVRILVF